jgi:transposase, IS5 family
MLRLQGGQVESLWDEVLPERLRELPEDLARIDALLRDEALLSPIGAHWDREAEQRGRSAKAHGRPTIPMQMYVRLMVLKHRYGWGYETLMREVSDSLHLRRFCLIAIDAEVPDESTVRKLTRRLGPETVAELSRLVIGKAQRETRFRARAVRIDSTVVEADVRYPTDAGLAGDGVRTLAREGKRLAGSAGGTAARVRDRSRAVGKRLRAIGRTLRRRTGEAKTEVLELTRQTGRLLAASAREARRVAAEARTKARALARSRKATTRRTATKILASIERLETLTERSEKVVEQIRKRLAGEPITNRLVSVFDPDARPIRKGKLGKQTEFGYIEQLAEVTPSTKPGARGFILPPATAPGNPGENELLPQTVAELQRLRLSPREVALDGGFQTKASEQALAPLAPERTFIAGRTSAGSRRTQRRLARYRVGCEGRISHLKRRHGLRRSRLKGGEGERTWTGWAVLAYNLETYGRYA